MAKIYDLTTPDGTIIALEKVNPSLSKATVLIGGIDPSFVGFDIDKESIFFNGKSTLAQLGVDVKGVHYELSKERQQARVEVEMHAIGSIAREFLALIEEGSKVGKLFAADDRRLVTDPDYLLRMFGRCDRKGRPLLSLGGMQGSDTLVLDRLDSKVVAYLALQNGKITYDPSIFGFLATLSKSLLGEKNIRELLQLHQLWRQNAHRNIDEDEILLVKTAPLHIRTVFARVVDSFLTTGYFHTSASVLQPDTNASGDVYELYGSAKREITDIPLEFYTLEPYREYIYFSDRTRLKQSLEDKEKVFDFFNRAPKMQKEVECASFVVTGKQLGEFSEKDWIAQRPAFQEFPGPIHAIRQAALVERYIESHPVYTYLKAIEIGDITSQGILFTRYFPSPLLKRILLSDIVSRFLKGIYFQHPSSQHEDFFSQEDRAFLSDLHKFAMPVYWADHRCTRILKYTQKRDRESGLFVPVDKVETFLQATVFGVYGSNLISGNFEKELRALLRAVIDLKKEMNHPLLHSGTPLALITGGGPGAMEMGNRIAQELDILSCANIADFHSILGKVKEQEQNPYVEAKMTYRLEQLVERQAEFNLDFPIFVMGGIGTDFEFCLEEVRRKVGAQAPTPVLLFGPAQYWKEKITSRFQCNFTSGTIAGSEWVSNCFYAIETAKEGVEIYKRYFSGALPIGPKHPYSESGFIEKV